ncbi:MAG: hypothetical protein J7L11_06600 [Thermoprotei archaeon]|nr:hypothetical protein [Thermoprotei archaeon]
MVSYSYSLKYHKFYKFGCWNVARTAGYSGSGTAVIAVTRDVNGSVGFLVWGWDERRGGNS